MRRTRRHAVCFLAVVALIVALPETIHFLRAQPARPALADEAEHFEPGLKLTITSGGAGDSRVARMIAIYVPKGAPPSSFLPPGQFTAVWEGVATLKIRDEYTFSSAGNGAIKVSFGDQIVLDASGDDLSKVAGKPTQLPKGKNVVRIEYKSPADGDAWMRLSWTAKGSIPEPIHPTFLTHDAADKTLRENLRLHEGRELFADLRCINCHAPDNKPAEGAMPELSIDAPSLVDAGTRLNAAWIARWIANPHAIRADATMPQLHLSSENASDIAAYLTSLKKAAEAPTAGDEVSGARVFAGLGCLTCHTLPDHQAAPDEPARVSLAHVKQKYQAAALREFLMQPEKRYRWTRMPNFKLTAKEAADVQAFLFSKAPDVEAASAGDAQKGHEAFTSSGCLNCHDAGTQPTKLAAPKQSDLLKADWSKGCVASDPAARGLAPDFHLTDPQRDALKSFASTDMASLGRDCPPEFAQRQYIALKCVACHNRDKEQSIWFTLTPEIDALEASLPPEPEGKGEQFSASQNRPLLTFVGEKLRPQWTTKFIAGEISYKPRPWIRARMPAFPARAAGLAQGLAMEQGFSPLAPDEPPPDAAQIPIGQKLVGRNGGFSCINCHDAGSMKALQPFEAPAPNFAHTSERLRKEFYHRWVRNPMKIDPGTKMPQFADPEGKTALKDTLDGDAVKQYEAIWQYLLQGEKLTPPE